MKYCAECYLPSTKPGLYFENGVCSACLEYKNRAKINWDGRQSEFTELVIAAKARKGSYDCIIPVSGGKDSTWQVIKALEHGLKPLCVNARTCDLSVLGRHNLNNISELGVDLVEFVPNVQVRRKLNKYCLQEIGDISWPEHVLIFTVPVRIAIEKNIPLILWGENSQNEYGAGPKESAAKSVLDKRWLDEFGGLNGLRVNDIIDAGIATKEEMAPYLYPKTQEELKSVFMGYYFPWDGLENSIIASQNGFKCNYEPIINSGVTHENLDNHQTGIHDHIKYLKYGFGRATDIYSTLLRHGEIGRFEAITAITKYDGAFPNSYLGKSIDDILYDIGMTVEDYNKICEKFVNKELFTGLTNGDNTVWVSNFKVGKDYA